MFLIGTLIKTEIELVWCAIICGFKISVVTWVLNAIRTFLKHGRMLRNIEDFIFASLVGVYIFVVLYEYNDGIIRAFILFFIVLMCYILNITIYRVLKIIVKKARIPIEKVVIKLSGRNPVNGKKEEKRLK